jgi:hypothetical protein
LVKEENGMFELYGKKKRCLWCGKETGESPREIILPAKQSSSRGESAIVCSDACEQSAMETLQSVRKNGYLFLIGIVSGLVLAVLGGFNRALRPAGVLVLGLTVLLFPFVTPQTVQIFGLRKGMMLGRLLGVILLVMGLTLFIKV